MKLSEARNFRRRTEYAASLQTDDEALECIDLFPKWKKDIYVEAGDRYRYNDVLYRVEQSHTTQEGWEPNLTPALWTVVSLEDWPEWIQPTGAQDAYMLGDHVSHNEKHWESIVDNNVWEPGIYGWEEK